MISQQSPSSTKIELPFIHSLINVKCTMCQRCLDKKTEPLLIRNQAGSLVSAQKMWLMLCSVQSLSCVRLFVTPWTAARQASLSIINSRSLLKLMSIASVMPSNLCHLILCHPLLLPSVFPSIRVFSNELVLCIRGQSIGVSASASVLPMNIQDWFPLWLAAWISVQSKGLSRVFSNTTVQKHQFISIQFSL